MPQKRFYTLVVFFTIFALVFTACAPAPQVTEPPVATEATEAPVATEPVVATEPAATGECPAITMADTQGVSAGTWTQQYEVAEFEAAANCTMTFTGRTEYDSRLVEYGFLPEGDLPPLE